MKFKEISLSFLFVCIVGMFGGCATIVNDSHIPVDFVFSDGSDGECTFKNKRGEWSCEMPCEGVMIRRSDDDLVYECKIADGTEVSGTVESKVEGGKMAASVIFWDLGITDAITDKHRRYDDNVIIPVSRNLTRSNPESDSDSTTDTTSEKSSEETPEAEAEKVSKNMSGE